MKAAFGLVSLLIVLAVVGWTAKSALQATAPASPAATSAPADGAGERVAPRQQVQAFEQELGKALGAAAAARASEAN